MQGIDARMLHSTQLGQHGARLDLDVMFDRQRIVALGGMRADAGVE